MADEKELKDLTFEIIRCGEAQTFHDAYHKARQQCVGLRNYAAQWNLDASVGLLCHRVTIWQTATKANAA